MASGRCRDELQEFYDCGPGKLDVLLLPPPETSILGLNLWHSFTFSAAAGMGQSDG
jgi:hypothetical protein